VACHSEGFYEGFANIYSDAAEVISARRPGNKANMLALYFQIHGMGCQIVFCKDSASSKSCMNFFQEILCSNIISRLKYH